MVNKYKGELNMSGKSIEQNFKKVYFTESRELLELMETSLLSLEKDTSDCDSINSIFRSIHTIKGNSGMFGYERIGDFAHIFENVLACARNGSLRLNSGMIELFFRCHDFLMVMVNFFENCENEQLDSDNEKIFNELTAVLNSYLASKSSQCVCLLEDVNPVSADSSSDESVHNDCWHISIRFSENVFRIGLDPYSFIKYLGEKGDIVNIKCVYDRMPESEMMDPENCYLGFEIDFRSLISKSDIENVFEFLMDDCELRILPPNTGISEYVKLIESLPENNMSIGEILREAGTLTEAELAKAIKLQGEGPDGENDTGSKKLLGEVLVNEKMVSKPVLDAALEKQKSAKKKDGSRTIRVEADKLDRLINLIGELVITGSNVKQISESNEKTGLIKAVNDMSKLIEEIRGSSMGIRMVQIGETFNRFERVIRDLSVEKGKKIKFVIMGGETELDKTLIDRLTDPLVHLVRNAVDHGIGTPEERIMAGKPREGTLTLNAYHETGSIVIEVRDDGQGLDTEKILKKAIDLGLVKSEQSYHDYDIFNFIFHPGFSTASEVTNISGRGVGMDVVKKNIESLRGTVMVESERGVGTIIRIHLPLTLAIIDGFMVKLADSFYVLPLDMVIECTEVSRSELDSKEGGSYINLRGDVLPFMKMREFFKEPGKEPEKPKIVVVEYARNRVGLVVDDLIGEFQTVIKPLGKIFNRLQWISGSTILGTGEVAYILDVAKLIHSAQAGDVS